MHLLLPVKCSEAINAPFSNSDDRTIMKKNTLLATALAAIVCSGATAQPAPSSSSPTAPDETITLSPFQVTADNTEGYIASESVTGTRIRADIRDLPFNVNVV
jgi:outer membrane receptor for ferric coprogen and ferric-rhodotorulic acid